MRFNECTSNATEKIIFNLPHQRSAERKRGGETRKTIISFKFDIKNSLLIAISLELHIALHFNGLPVESGLKSWAQCALHCTNERWLIQQKRSVHCAQINHSTNPNARNHNRKWMRDAVSFCVCFQMLIKGKCKQNASEWTSNFVIKIREIAGTMRAHTPFSMH